MPERLSRQVDGRVQGVSGAEVVDLDDSFRMRVTDGDRGELAEVRRDADGGKAGTGRLDARDEREQVVDGMRGPCVRVGAGVAGNFRPGAEVERQQLAPGIEGLKVVVGHAGVFQGAREIEAEVV